MTVIICNFSMLKYDLSFNIYRVSFACAVLHYSYGIVSFDVCNMYIRTKSAHGPSQLFREPD